METNLKALLIGVGTIITCAILSIFFLFKKDAQRADSRIVDAYDNQQSFLNDDVTDYDGKTVEGGELLSFINKYQNDYKIGIKTENITKYYNKENPKVNNSPASLDYVNPSWNFSIRFSYRNGEDVKGIYATQIGSYPNGQTIAAMTDSEQADPFIMFTESGCYTVPAGVHTVRISACASGKGIYAGEFVGADGEYSISVNEGDELSFVIQYLDDTIIYLNGTQIKRLRAGVIDDAYECTLFGYYTGRNGSDGENGLKNGVRISSERGTAIDDGLGGHGGYGGAFGFGGGGGAGASVDTYDQIVVNESNHIVDYEATASAAAAGTSGKSESSPVVRAVGGSGSTGKLRWDSKTKFQLVAGTGGNGTLYFGGKGGTTSFSTYGFSPLNAVIAAGANPLTMFSAVSGAGGGGGAGGYGAGGGEGGHGIKDDGTVYEYYNPDTDETAYLTNLDALSEIQKHFCTEITGIESKKAGDGAPTGGMVYLYCY